MHHEPIHTRHLEADQNRIYELAEYVAPGATTILERVNTLTGVLAHRPAPTDGARGHGLRRG